MKKLSAIQSVAWETGLQAIKDSSNFETFDAFSQHLRDGIRQNSQVTRQRYANLIVKRLFPNHRLDNILTQAWRAFHDEAIIIDLARVTTLQAEPVIAKFVMERLMSVAPGTALDTANIKDFIGAVYGSFKSDSYDRLTASIRHMGFVTRGNGQYLVQALPRPSNALLILLHAWLAPTPRIVRVSDILVATDPDLTNGSAYPFWHLLGMRDESEVRAILRDAESAGLIAKYAVVDQLEQITTRYSLDDYLAGAYRL